ncbi:MAG: GGDEF domain-containing protein [Acidobacteriota bacterium]
MPHRWRREDPEAWPVLRYHPAVRRYLAPLIPLAAAVAVLLLTDGRWLGHEALPTVQRVAIGLALLLGWRLRRGRVAWIALAVAAFTELATSNPGDAAVLVGALWLAVDLAAAAALREWWFLSRPGLVRLGALGAQALTVFLLARSDDATQAALLAVDDGWSTAWPILGQLSMEPMLAGAVVLAAAACAVALAIRKTPLESGFLWSAVALGCGLAVDGGLRFFVTAIALALAVALVENAFSLAFNDGLTGLPARRALEERLEQLGRHYSLAMLDLDQFKKLNDRHGHEVGDQVLRLVSSRLKKAPGGGRAFRYGGEEFTVVFAGQGADEAAIYLDALRQQIASRPFVVRSPARPARKPKDGAKAGGAKTIEKSLKVTVSIGVAERSDKAPTPDTVMKAADRALYKSKKAGRNRVTVG